MFALQIYDTDKKEALPRYVYDAEFLHDAVNDYCSYLKVNQRDVSESRSAFRRYFWMERQETFGEEPTFDIYEATG